MSIGSPTDGGASAIRVSDLSIDGSDNGLRIKSNITRGGEVKDVVFDDICIRDTPNPILMDTSYTAHASKESNRIPFFHDIVVRDVAVGGPGKVTLDGYDAAHPVGIQFDNVVFDEPGKIKVAAHNADVRIGPGAFPLKIEGDHIRVTGTPGTSSPNNCGGKLIDFPTQH